MREFRVLPLTMSLLLLVAVPGVGRVWAQSFEPAGSIPHATGVVPGPVVAGDPGADEIVRRLLERNRERLAALESYTTERTYRMEYHGAGGDHWAQVEVHAVYTRPERKHLTVVSQSGSKVLCEEVLRKMVKGEEEATERNNRVQMSLGPENYHSELVGAETLTTPGSSERIKTWVLRVTPRVENKFTYAGRVWVSQDDYAIVRVVAEPAKAPSWLLNRSQFDAWYLRRNGVWLPARNVSSSHVRIGGEATMTIDYGTYPVVVAGPVKAAASGVEDRAARVVQAALR